MTTESHTARAGSETSPGGSPTRNYVEYIGGINDARVPGEPMLSVIVVAYRRPELLEACLESLKVQRHQDFEVILAHNGGAITGTSWRKDLSIARIDLKRNFRQLIARNVGASIARGKIYFFVDDDTIVDRECLSAIAELFGSTRILAARSRMLARTPVIFNRLASHYDLGDEELEGRLMENGMAIRASTFHEFGGYDESLLPGGEFMYWVYHIGRKYGLDRVVYCPSAVIRTDFATDFFHFLRKRWRNLQGHEHIRIRYPEMETYVLEAEARFPTPRRRSKKRIGLRLRSVHVMGRIAGWLGRQRYHISRP